MKPENFRRWTIHILRLSQEIDIKRCQGYNSYIFTGVWESQICSYYNFSFLIDIIYNIITYSPYSLNNVMGNFSQCKKIKNYNRSKPEILRLLWDIIVFTLVAYLLNMICLILQLLYKIAYMNFRINLTQLYINFSRQEHQIDLHVSFNVWDSQVSSYTPFYFSFTVPLSDPVLTEFQFRFTTIHF